LSDFFKISKYLKILWKAGMNSFYWIDAFCEGPFTGNPAGVCLLEKKAPVEWMKGLAGELNLSETAFVQKEGESFGLRWFTPSGVEVKLCGHATLASAQALVEEGWISEKDVIRFQTLSGELRAWKRKDKSLLELDFPERLVSPAEAPVGMLKALGIEKPTAVAREADDWLVECGDEKVLRSLDPDFEALKAAGGRGICVTARAATSGADFVSRFFAPAVGINEDPVTGSAHCYLGPYWSFKLNKAELTGRQLSRRGGLVSVGLKQGRVFLSGEARTVVRGEVR
jgi:PhzF family phenazine biosynthesis protein